MRLILHTVVVLTLCNGIIFNPVLEQFSYAYEKMKAGTAPYRVSAVLCRAVYENIR